ncbi:hypothetical protein SARC_03693 [Sphaeroforma arctica JP610]|uniref:RRM domain-containing protein n=1 Tax=Sphaeroforma arctica JP610 TaxID=667725 RepID=A0A0L0G4X7_9EUKA|nr:hypothetical protein SARC_03693 [Sphaeroforma arctica JP610]KNC84065.1 hypothetical protein SARC_03693 [Sphaeroforma arctica JP610]|eukprot:XP_014157967.1 hypothetical protein SARC_03693 [Sphaeroforma arctica JP610]
MVDLLTQHGDLVEDDAESGSVGCWMDKQRTKCCCTFQTYEAAASALNAIDGIKWPQGNQKQLSVTFISLSEAHALCQSASGKGRVAVASHGPNGNDRRASAAVEQERLKAREAAQRRKSEAEKEKVKEKETKKEVDEKKKPRKVVALDQIFRKTTAEPPLYWMEVDAQEIEVH